MLEEDPEPSKEDLLEKNDVMDLLFNFAFLIWHVVM